MFHVATLASLHNLYVLHDREHGEAPKELQNQQIKFDLVSCYESLILF